MPSQLEESPNRDINELLDAVSPNSLKQGLCDDAHAQVIHPRSEDSAASLYKLFVVETRPNGQREIYALCEYTESDLAGIATRPTFRFRWMCERLLEKAEQVSMLDADNLEFEHQATLLWADVASLSEHVGSSPEIDELIAAFHIAYAQHAKRLTPKPLIEALALAFRLASRYTRLPAEALEEVLDALERAGVDLNYPMAFAKADA